MEIIIRKFIYLTLLLSLSNNAYTKCSEYLREQIASRIGINPQSLQYQLKRFEFARYEVIKQGQVERVKSLTKKYGINTLSSKRFVDVINSVILKIIETNGQSLESAEQLAQFGFELRKIYKENGLETTTAIDSFLGVAISRIESYKSSEYQRGQSSVTSYLRLLDTSNGGQLIRPNEYKKWVSSYVNKEGVYQSMLPSSHGVISFKDYRNLTANNLWPLFLKNHDIRHVHYSVSHPKVMAIILANARSKNHKRYFLLSALFEGVDTVQYTHERRLSKYFNSKGLTLEQAMMYLSRATESELNKVIDESNINYRVNSFLQNMASFKPLNPTEHNNTNRQKYLQREVDQMLEEFHRYSKEDTDVNMNGVMEYHPHPHGRDSISKAESERIRY